MHRLYAYLSVRNNEWEQKAFQLIVMRYLVGIGDELPPLRYRLLPTTQFVNIQMYERRRTEGLNTSETIAVHCGYLNTYGDKLEHMELNGFLEHGLYWHRRMAAAIQGTPFNASGSRPQKLSLRRKDRTLVEVLV